MTKYKIWDEGSEIIIDADDMDDAKSQARDWIKGGSWDTSGGTIWCDAQVAPVPTWDDDAVESIDSSIDSLANIEIDGFDGLSINEINNGTLPDGTPEVLREAAEALHVLRCTALLDRENCDNQQESVTVRFDQDEPKCSSDDGHDWQSPYSIVGGIKENPGVWGHGGGVVINECCMNCGCQKSTDTWAQRGDTGEQGLTSVSYTPGVYELEESES